eukprot:TRINITY_DN3856_c0_g1_i1.p1 TRINITY_DN3856_c0_g1~~TRINITY_DN3856_c0_g1_i1.p1  ORF type:complete len:341 (-),score=125.23 TRINITY_DN3856_c0_g1_i1:46-1068(-)
MSQTKTRAVHLINRPAGLPDAKKDFAVVEEQVPQLEEGSVLLRSLYVSVDPYMRGRMKDTKSYVPPFQLNQPLEGGVVAEVEESKNDKFKTGDIVLGQLPWRERNVVSKVDGLNKLTVQEGVSPSYYLGVLGMPGMTALLAFENIGEPKEGETLVVSGAAGAVGSLVGQLGKILGLRVVGIAGGQEKINFLKNKLGFDEVIDYKSTDDIKGAIAKACPKGVDIYYDNVGGTISDGVSANFNRFGRWVLCGAISQYNSDKVETGPRDEFLLISRSIKKQGFIVSQWAGPKWVEGVTKMAGYLKEGKIVVEETVKEGFENIPNAFVELLTGGNTGKMVVKVK